MAVVMWQRLREDRKRQKEIEAQISRIELLSRGIPERDPQMEEWGFMPDEVKNLDQAEQWLAVLRTTDILRRSSRHNIEMPDKSDPSMYGRMDWDADQNEPYFLTGKGFRVAQLALRDEEKYHWDKWSTRISAITALMSLFVAILALLFGK
ncbi:UNVERIFIED_ORG: hypothetical protein J2W87_001582 [Pseudomonas putida]|nr:hypothetical protein [Pseudomonas putida]